MNVLTAPLRIDQPGIYDLSDADYLADPVVMPSLNNSIAKLLVELSPAHAHAAHPRFGGADDDDDDGTEAQSVGTAAHSMFLRGADIAKLIPFPTFQSNAAKAARDMALFDGKIPLKQVQYDAAHRLVDVLEAFRARTGAFTAGKPEQTVIWREGEVWARAKVDWLCDDPEAPLWDLKTISGRATSSSWGRNAFQLGSDMQSVWYPRGVECVRGEPPGGVLFCVIETRPPYAMRVFGMSPIATDMAEEKLQRALALWATCTTLNQWPAYPDEPEWIDPPPWIVREWEGKNVAYGGGGFRSIKDVASRVAGNTAAARDALIREKIITTGNFGG